MAVGSWTEQPSNCSNDGCETGNAAMAASRELQSSIWQWIHLTYTTKLYGIEETPTGSRIGRGRFVTVKWPRRKPDGCCTTQAKCRLVPPTQLIASRIVATLIKQFGWFEGWMDGWMDWWQDDRDPPLGQRTRADVGLHVSLISTNSSIRRRNSPASCARIAELCPKDRRTHRSVSSIRVKN
jgi:hypothetical protein